MKKQMFTKLLVVVLVFQYVQGDIYLHYPRGSNNRLNGKPNQQRLFDSQVVPAIFHVIFTGKYGELKSKVDDKALSLAEPIRSHCNP